MKKIITTLILSLSLIILLPATAFAKGSYGMGNSIMEGLRNNYMGVCDIMQYRFGYNVITDTSKSGAFLSPNTIAPNNIIAVEQYQRVRDSISKNGYDRDTIIVIDCGGNDAMYLSYCNMNKIPSSVSIDKIMFCTGLMLYQLADQVGNTDKSRGWQVPIYFIIPSIQDPYFSAPDDVRITMFTYVARQTQVVESMADLGIIPINLNAICADYKTTQADPIHPNWYGYLLITNYIATHKLK